MPRESWSVENYGSGGIIQGALQPMISGLSTAPGFSLNANAFARLGERRVIETITITLGKVWIFLENFRFSSVTQLVLISNDIVNPRYPSHHWGRRWVSCFEYKTSEWSQHNRSWILSLSYQSVQVSYDHYSGFPISSIRIVKTCTSSLFNIMFSWLTHCFTQIIAAINPQWLGQQQELIITQKGIPIVVVLQFFWPPDPKYRNLESMPGASQHAKYQAGAHRTML